MTTPTAPRLFHLGIAVDPQCKDWKTVSEALTNVVSRRVADGETIVVHDVTPWWTTKVALLWAIGNGHAVDYCSTELHNAENNNGQTRLDTLRRYQQLDALVGFHNGEVTGRSYHEATHEVAFCLHYTMTQLYRPVRQVKYTAMEETPALYPYRQIQAGQIRRYGPTIKEGRFYAPKATEQAATLWINFCIERLGTAWYEPQLKHLAVDPDGWWLYRIEQESTD
ncbi:MAG: hypothetical protein U0X20_16935 [Caldilineaceae bacterium]